MSDIVKIDILNRRVLFLRHIDDLLELLSSNYNGITILWDDKYTLSHDRAILHYKDGKKRQINTEGNSLAQTAIDIIKEVTGCI